MKRLVVLGLFSLLVSPKGFGQEYDQPKPKPVARELSEKELLRLDKKGRKPPSGAGFFISPVEGRKAMFSVLLADDNGKSVTGTFTLQQVDVFEAVLEASKAFALTDEKVGTASPIVTRLMEQHEWSLFVDVSKIGNRSRLYVSLVTPTGRLTAEAGEITRGSKKEPSALLLKMIAQVQEAKASAKTMQ